MRYTEFGNTGIHISVIGFGCWAIAGDPCWGSQCEEDALDAIKTAFNEGINFFDTAESYGGGASEYMLGKALSDVRQQVIIATKASPHHLDPESLFSACEASLERLRTDYIDLYQIHWHNPQVPIADTLGVLEHLKQQGKIRAYGFSNFGVNQMQNVLDSGHPILSNQLGYNLLFRAVEDRILPFCLQQEIPVLCYSPLMQGLLSGKYNSIENFPEGRMNTRLFSDENLGSTHQETGAEEEVFSALQRIHAIAEELGESMVNLSLSWLLHQPAVTAVLVGGRNVRHVKHNLRSVDIRLPQITLDRLDNITDPVRQKLGANPDLWMSESRIN